MGWPAPRPKRDFPLLDITSTIVRSVPQSPWSKPNRLHRNATTSLIATRVQIRLHRRDRFVAKQLLREHQVSGRFIGATGCVLLVASVLVVTGPAAAPELRWRPVLHVPTIVDVVGPRADGQLVLGTRGGLLLVRPGRPATEFARGPAGYVAAGGEPYMRSRLPGDCETLGAPSSETMSSRSMPTRRRASFGSAGPGRQSGSSTSPLTPSLPVSPSTWLAGSAFASSSQRLSPVRRLSTRSTASAAVQWWHETHPASKGAWPSPPPRSVGLVATSSPPTSSAGASSPSSDRSRSAGCRVGRCRGRRHRR